MSPPEVSSDGTVLRARKDDAASLLKHNGVDLETKSPVDPNDLVPQGDVEWTCGSLLEVATNFFHASGQAITDGNIPLATTYYQVGSAFQQAFDAQCDPIAVDVVPGG